MLPLDPFGRPCALPAGMTREDRVQLLKVAADALMAGELPDAPARLFLAGALCAWLEQGGSLEGKFLRVRPPRGSHHTPAALLRKREASSQ